jgi:hypothetical protein
LVRVRIDDTGSQINSRQEKKHELVKIVPKVES